MSRSRRDRAHGALPPGAWPERDRQAWEGLFEAGGLFDEPGRGLRWRPASRTALQGAFGRWLRFLDEQGWPDGATSSGVEALTPPRLQAYVTSLRARGLAPLSVRSYVSDLAAAARAMRPSLDLAWLRRIVARLWAAAGNAKPIDGGLRASRELFLLGCRLMDTVEARRPHHRLDRSSWFRDGLMVALLAARPIRARNLGMMRLGRHLIRRGDGWWLVFEPDETKTRRAIEVPLPGRLVPYLERYLESHRPRLLQGGDSDALWISNLGRAMAASSIHTRIKRATARGLGTPLGPHRFRHAAATSISLEDPAHVHMIAAILGHSTLATGQRYYDRGSAAVAAGRYAAAIRVRRRRRDR